MAEVAKSNRWVGLAALGVALAIAAAYGNTFTAPFIFDDIGAIFDNPTIHHLWPPWEALSPPGEFAYAVTGRPLPNFSLALNYAISGTTPWSYHAFNLGVHVAAALTLLGLVRRTLLLPTLAPRFGSQALPIATVIAAVWGLHPLPTQAVTYVVQRAESMMALSYLLTLYGFVRSIGSRHEAQWRWFAVAMSALGMLCKEVMATAPLVVLLFDRTFVAGSFSAAWRARKKFYLALALTWVPLGMLVGGAGGTRNGLYAFTPAAFADRWLAQFEALVRYLQLSVWPRPLVFEYGERHGQSLAQVLPFALPVIALMAVTCWAMARRPQVGFLAACFFLILAPACAAPGRIQPIMEYRMYLPLAAVVVLLVLTLTAWGGTRGLIAGGMIAVGLGGVTVQRNSVYRSDLTLWEDTVAKAPRSFLARENLGAAYFNRGNLAQAREHYAAGLQLDPHSGQAHFNLAVTLEALGEREAAATQYREAIAILPQFAQAHAKLGGVLARLRRGEEALSYLREAVRLAPNLADVFYRHLADAFYQLGLELAAKGQAMEAIDSFQRAVQFNPHLAGAWLNLGTTHAQLERLDEATRSLREAVRVGPDSPEAWANLGNVLALNGQVDEALKCYEEALRLRPEYAVAHYNYGNTLMRLRRWAEAREHFTEALRISPDFSAARERLARLPES